MNHRNISGRKTILEQTLQAGPQQAPETMLQNAMRIQDPLDRIEALRDALRSARFYGSNVELASAKAHLAEARNELHEEFEAFHAAYDGSKWVAEDDRIEQGA